MTLRLVWWCIGVFVCLNGLAFSAGIELSGVVVLRTAVGVICGAVLGFLLGQVLGYHTRMRENAKADAFNRTFQFWLDRQQGNR